MVKKVDTQLKRPPVVTVMGHVDHGKTSLLDSIRGSFVANKEVGGITQNITAFDVVHDSRHITFIDTPGHELFSNMRQSGVLMTDIVLLIIAVDDGIMPQTKEVIEIIKENNLNVIVVFNKIDLPSNNLAKIKSDLGREGIFLEEFGGKVLSVEVSAKTKKGVNDLLDLILLQYDMLDNIYTPSERNSLVVLESFKDPHVGNISLCIVEDGTLSQGDNIFSLKRGELGKVRSIKNDKSESLKEAGVSTPVYIFGQSLFLDVGEKIVFSKDKIKLDINKEKLDLGKFEEEDRDSFLFPKEEVKMLSIILKADTKGSLDAIVTALEKIELEEIKIKIFKKDLGDLTDEDLNIAKSTRSIIIGFNISQSSRIKKLASNMHIIIMIYDIIYRLVDDVKDAAESLIPPSYVEIENGKAEIKEIFILSNKSTVLGSLVFEGKMVLNSRCKILRKGDELFDSKIVSLRNLKNEVKEVSVGMECGIIIAPNFTVEKGDTVISYRIEKN